MEYTIQLAELFIGKRVVVGTRHIDAHGQETYSGLWGVIDSVHEGGLLLKVEGGIDDHVWMLPPDLDALKPAQHSSYQMDGFDEIVTNVDYEAFFRTAESLEELG